MADAMRKKVAKAIKARDKEVNPPKSSLTYSTPKEKGPRVSTKTANIVANRTRGKESAFEKLNRVMYADPRPLTAAETRAAKIVQSRRNQDLKKTAARGMGILKTQAKKKAKSNARKAIGG
jgi:hypothetical protein